MEREQGDLLSLAAEAPVIEGEVLTVIGTLGARGVGKKTITHELGGGHQHGEALHAGGNGRQVERAADCGNPVTKASFIVTSSPPMPRSYRKLRSSCWTSVWRSGHHLSSELWDTTAMAQTIAELLEAAGIKYRPVRAAGTEGFLLTELPAEGVEGVRAGPGLFLVATTRARELVAVAVAGGEIVESGTLQLGDRTVAVHRYTKPGEPAGNLKRRAGWFQRRLR